MPGSLVHFELPAQDTARAKRFWSGVFDWSFNDAMMEGFDYSMVRTGENQGGAVYPDDGSMRGPIVYFDTDDIDASIAKVRSSAGRRTTSSRSPRRLVRALHRHRGQRLQPLPERRDRRPVTAVAALLALLAGLAGSVQVAVMGRFGGRVGVVAALDVRDGRAAAALGRDPRWSRAATGGIGEALPRAALDVDRRR